MRSECPEDEWKNVGHANNRRAEYRLLIEEILAEDASLREQNLPGLSIDEINQLRVIVLAALEWLQFKRKEQTS